MPGNPVFEAFCAKIEELGGEEYVFDKLRAGESVSQVAKGVDNRSRDMLYKWLWRGGDERRKKWDAARKDGAEGWLDKGAEAIEGLKNTGNMAADVSAANSKANYYEKMATRLNPERFDKQGQAVTDVASLLLQALQHAGTAKQIAKPEPQMLEAEIITEDDG
jgi:hypothetical protein